MRTAEERQKVLPPERLARGATVSLHAPLDEGGEKIAEAHTNWEDGSIIKAWSTTEEGNRWLVKFIETRRKIFPVETTPPPVATGEETTDAE